VALFSTFNQVATQVTSASIDANLMFNPGDAAPYPPKPLHSQVPGRGEILQRQPWPRVSGEALGKLPSGPRSSSTADGRPEISQRQLRSGFTTTLSAMLDVTPTAQQAGALRVEQHHERLRQRIDLDAVARLPFRRCRCGMVTGSLHKTTESRVLHVDDPRTVARLDDDLFHAS
jgi:hypothetical protein